MGVPQPKKKPKRSISKLKKKADAIFSKYIRNRDKGFCYTCPHKDDPKWMQNGHFIPRQYLSVRYDEVNCHCQCYACNQLYNGQPGAYAIRLEKEYGQGTVARLEALKWQTVKYFPYEELIEKYTTLVNEQGTAEVVPISH